MKPKKKKPETKHAGFRLIGGTAGHILNGIYLKDDKSEIKIELAWGGTYHFKPLNENEKSL